jgi:hypothetical protein
MLDFVLHLSRDVPGMRKARVSSEQPGMHVRPVSTETRKALPFQYRAAFDRANDTWWQNKHDTSDNPPLYLELRSARGKYLNTVHAIPAR